MDELRRAISEFKTGKSCEHMGYTGEMFIQAGGAYLVSVLDLLNLHQEEESPYFRLEQFVSSGNKKE